MSTKTQDSELVEHIRVFAMDVRDRDGVPPAGNTNIQIHPSPKDDITNPHGFGAASFRFGQTLYTMVAVPNPKEDKSKELPGVTTHLTAHSGDQVHYAGMVGDIARDLGQQIQRDTNASARSRISLDYARRPHQEFVDLADGRISRNTSFAARLADVQTAMGIAPEEKLTALQPREAAATPA